jgi:sterol desaturase/sphingolipid hydroxylase (fatty acid hydroxylase superfamily)
MSLFSMEHGQAAYRADFAIYGGGVASLAAVLLTQAPRGQSTELTALATAGLAGWTAIEYLLHRFVLHGIAPFRRWHEEHHHRPHALLCTPTILSAALIFCLVFLPSLSLGSIWRALALTTGVLAGYFCYTLTHHATHHWRASGRWLKRRKRWHALHHHDPLRPSAYGVTTAFWDHAFGTAKPLRHPQGLELPEGQCADRESLAMTSSDAHAENGSQTVRVQSKSHG